MDIAILAGGYGTRLWGVWNGPKCLVPYKGRPIIELLVNKALELKPRKVFLLLGYKASAVVQWRENCFPHRDVVPIIETEPLGTAYAIRNVLPLITYPLMVLNGDTVPFYDLSELVSAFTKPPYGGRTVAAWSNKHYAGASILSSYSQARLNRSMEPDFDSFLYTTEVLRLETCGFLDIGTPEDFKKAQEQCF